MGNEKIVIGIAGPKGSGKTTLARFIELELIKSERYRHSDVEISPFAKPLKDFLKDFFELSDEQLTVYEAKEAIDPRYGVSPRVLMQEFGTGFVRRLIPGFWVQKMKETVNNSQARVIIIDDVRFEDEAQLVRDHHGLMIHITGRSKPKSTLSRLKQLLVPTHPSERPVRILPYDSKFENSRDGVVFLRAFAKKVKGFYVPQKS